MATGDVRARRGGGEPFDWRGLAKRGGAAVVVSVLINVIVLQAVLAADAVAASEHFAIPRVALFTALGAVAATVVYGVIRHWSDTPDRTFTVVAAVALVLSLVPDVGLVQSDPGVTVGAGVVLMAMHVTTAAVCVGFLTDRFSPLAE